MRETVFTLEATPIKFGAGAVDDAGWELSRLGVSRALLVTDPGIPCVGRVVASLRASGISVVVFDGVRVEPTLSSLQEAADFALSAEVDGFVSVGGGSCIDTAKVADLITSHPAPVMDYVNAPIGGGVKPPGPLRPHLAIPTTCGTGSEATTVAVLDIPERAIKTGISHRYLRPTQAIVDPSLASTLPSEVVASAGLDVVCHAAESFLSRPFSSRERPASPDDRPPYQGANPVADIWSQKALEYGGRFLRRAVSDASDEEARGAMMLAASMAGVGFGSAGVHIPHSCAYPIAGLKHSFVPRGYPSDHPFVPHGISVIVTAPAAFRFTYSADPGAIIERPRCWARTPPARTRCRTSARLDARPGRADERFRARLRRIRHPGAGRRGPRPGPSARRGSPRGRRPRSRRNSARKFELKSRKRV